MGTPSLLVTHLGVLFAGENNANPNWETFGNPVFRAEPPFPEASAQAVFGVAGTVSKLAVQADNVGTGRSVKLRKNGADGTLIVSPTNTTAGLYEDATHSDHFAVGDKHNLKFVHTGHPVYRYVRGVFTPDSGHAGFYALGNINALFTTSGHPRQYITPLSNQGLSAHGEVQQLIEANTQQLIRSPGTLKNMCVYVDQDIVKPPFVDFGNSAGMTIRTRINGAYGNSIISLAANPSDAFYQDSTHSDVLASGDLLSVAIDFAGGPSFGNDYGGLGCSFFACTIENSGNSNDIYSVYLGTISTSFSSPRYIALNSNALATAGTTETDAKIRHGFDGRISNLRINVVSNAHTTDIRLRLRKNGANGNSLVTVPAGQVGWFEDTVNFDTFLAADDICMQLDLNGGSGNFNFACAGLTENTGNLSGGGSQVLMI